MITFTDFDVRDAGSIHAQVSQIWRSVANSLALVQHFCESRWCALFEM